MPDIALREAILNAVVHKDYASGVPVQISVYADKLMIWNPGQLPPGWTLDKLKGKHNSLPANPDIANAFFRAGLIEAWGLGIERIITACAEAKMPEPEFEYDATGLWTTFRFGESVTGKMPSSRNTTTQETGQENAGPPKTPPKTPAKTPAKTPVETPVETQVETKTPVEARVGVKSTGFYVQRMKTKWGSCNPDARTMRFNSELAKKPIQCLEYIVVHELMHLKERRHNDRFIALMDRHMPLWRQYRDMLNKSPLAHEEWGY